MKVSRKEVSELYNAIEFNHHLTVDSAEVEKLLKQLLDKCLANKKKKRTSEYLYQLKILIANLLQVRGTPASWLSIEFGSNAYPGNRYKLPTTKGVLVDGIIKILKEAGYLHIKPGYRADSRELVSQGRNTRIKPKGILLRSLNNTKSYIYKTVPHKDSVWVQVKEDKYWDAIEKRNKWKKKKLDYVDTDFSNRRRQQVNLINKSLEDVLISLWLPDDLYIDAHHKANKHHTYYYCVFNDMQLNTGGRLYGHYTQNLKKEYRPYITIGHTVTQEVDFVGFHPNMLYHKCKLQLPEADPYEIDLIERKLVKLIFNILLNCPTKSEAIKAIMNKIEEKGLKLPVEVVAKIYINQIIDLLLKKHKPINKYFFQSQPVGLELQKLDSEIAVGVMLQMIEKHNTKSLSIHDSFIVQSEYTACLKEVMCDVYKSHLGFSPQVSDNVSKVIALPLTDTPIEGHDLYAQDAKNYLIRTGKVTEQPLEPPSFFGYG
jgi:hypothetical protein